MFQEPIVPSFVICIIMLVVSLKFAFTRNNTKASVVGFWKSFADNAKFASKYHLLVTALMWVQLNFFIYEYLRAAMDNDLWLFSFAIFAVLTLSDQFAKYRYKYYPPIDNTVETTSLADTNTSDSNGQSSQIQN